MSMKAGFRGTFVIPWSQTRIDGEIGAPVDEISPGRSWVWTGEAVRVDGPNDVLPLGSSDGALELKQRAAKTVQRLLRIETLDTARNMGATSGPDFNTHFLVTNGRQTWMAGLIALGAGRKPLLIFQDELPPKDRPLWVVHDTLDTVSRYGLNTKPRGVICFTPGTMILTPDGLRDVASLMEGDLVQTQDNGAAEILWLGMRHMTGARLKALPDLAPVRLRAGALERGVPDAGLLVSADHRMILRGPKSRVLFGEDEVLAAARDLIDDISITREYGCSSVTYIHMLLPQHEIVFANGVATESFHPSSAEMDTLCQADRERLFIRLPELLCGTDAYGGFARRVLTKSEAAILQYGTRVHA